MMMPEIVILGTQGFFHHAEPLKRHFGDRLIVEGDYTPHKILSHKPDLVITFEASNPQRGLCTAEMMRSNIATLLVMDGIQEWRNTWSRTRGMYKRPLNQPALVHKIACLGQVDARLYESWGNAGKCEIVGAPRLDELVVRKRSPRTKPLNGRPMRLLVMTARTPGFTSEETEVTLQSLNDLQEVLKNRQDIQVVWRISKGLHIQVGVQNTYNSATGEELNQLLLEMDAVITTPSTAQLEAMLLGLPTALLNYHSVPVYTPAAWEVKCKEHIEKALSELASPPLERMIYQDYCLNDALACQSPAMPRLVYLIEQMIKTKRVRDLNPESELKFPNRILENPELFVSWPSERFNLENLYPDHPVFGKKDVTQLQSELDAALITVEQLKDQIKTLTKRLHRIPGYIFLRDIVRAIQRKFYLGGHYRV